MNRILSEVRDRWRDLAPWQREVLITLGICTSCAAVGYWFGYHDGRRDG